MTASLYVDSSDSRLAGDQKVIRYYCNTMQQTLALVTAGWKETKKSPASRLAGDLTKKITADSFTFIHKTTSRSKI